MSGLGMSARASGGTNAATTNSATAAGAMKRLSQAGNGVAGGNVAPPNTATSNSSSTGPTTWRLRVSHGGDSTRSIGCAAVTGPSQINVSLRHRHVGTPGPVCT